MIEFSTLDAAWRDERARRLAKFRRLPALAEHGLELGAMTVLAKRIRDRWGAADLAVDGREARILALLAVAYWHPVSPSVIGNLRRAAKAMARGDRALAAIHIAQTGLQKIDENERTAFRLFAAERLLDAGVSPRELMCGLGLDPWPLDALKYNPAESRDERGRWTSEGGDASRTMPTASVDDFDVEATRGAVPFQEAQNAPPVQPTPLRMLHAESTYLADPKAARSFEFWNLQSTEDIVGSLRPGTSSMPLQVKPDGTVMDGNTRLRVLQGRGYDIESLPRQLYLTAPIEGGSSSLEME